MATEGCLHSSFIMDARQIIDYIIHCIFSSVMTSSVRTLHLMPHPSSKLKYSIYTTYIGCMSCVNAVLIYIHVVRISKQVNFLARCVHVFQLDC